MGKQNLARAKGIYEMRSEFLNTAEKFRLSYPASYRRVLSDFNKAKRAYEKLLAKKGG